MPTPADLQRDIARLTGLAQADLAAILRRVGSAVEAEEALRDLLPALTRQYGEAAALIAAEWYDDLREQYLDAAPRWSAYPANLGDQGVQALIGWAKAEATTDDALRALLTGGMSRRIADWSRETIMGSTFADPRAEGWMRVGRVTACKFCRKLVSRGAVYTEKTVRFGSHDHCNCGAAPSWGGASDVFDVDAYRRSVRRASMSEDVREADNARAREWIADNL